MTEKLFSYNVPKLKRLTDEEVTEIIEQLLMFMDILGDPFNAKEDDVICRKQDDIDKKTFLVVCKVKNEKLIEALSVINVQGIINNFKLIEKEADRMSKIIKKVIEREMGDVFGRKE